MTLIREPDAGFPRLEVSITSDKHHTFEMIQEPNNDANKFDYRSD